MLNTLAVGAAVLALLVWFGRGLAPKGSSGAWRIVSGTVALTVFVAAAAIMIRGGWLKGLPLIALGLGLLLAARSPKPARGSTQGSPPATSARMSASDARAMLGVDADASREEIEAAYKRLMMRVHPDHGGASGLAAQLNAARDVLLKRR
jgi:hypothetical protein